MPENLKTDLWTKIGFQGKNPRTDFRGGGYLALKCLIYTAKQHPNLLAQYRAMDSEKYFYAITSINMTVSLFTLNYVALSNRIFVHEHP